MELRVFAEQVLLGNELAVKLRRPELPGTDAFPGEPVRIDAPGRPANLQFAARRTAPAMPSPQQFRELRSRGVAHHIMANHELQALEVMAWVLLAFPDAPRACREGIALIMIEEQHHTRMHIRRAEASGVPFGSLPVNSHIWSKARSYHCLLDYFAGLPLTFETRNLDHSLEFEQMFLQAGDVRSAAVMRRIHEDEIGHVAFGWDWLNRLKPPEATMWQTYEGHLHWPMRPEKSIGDTFQREARLAAGLSPEFVEKLASLQGLSKAQGQARDKKIPASEQSAP